MRTTEMSMIEKLDQQDQDKVSYFIRLLAHQAKYHALNKEIALRREEIRQGNTLTHEDIWETVNV